jgi:hypothetical protein
MTGQFLALKFRARGGGIDLRFEDNLNGSERLLCLPLLCRVSLPGLIVSG